MNGVAGLKAGPVDWRDFHATVSEGDEVIGWSYWARLTYVSATTLRLTFFSVVPATKRLGNMQVASQLPARVSFAIAAIRVVPIVRPYNASAISAVDNIQLGVADDVAQLTNEGVATLTILNKPYYECPIYMLPAGTGVLVHSQGFEAADYIQTVCFGAPDPRAVQTLAKPIAIPPQTAFNVLLEWDAVNTLDSSDMDLVVILDGEVIRPQQ